jgi:5-methylcytosine-specific restriction endonuclease McrA
MYWTQALTLARRDGGYFCRYCGAALIPPENDPAYTLPVPGAVKGTVDHLIPVERGGHHGTGNLGLSCLPCNVDKACLTEREYRKLLKDRR